MEDFLKIFLNFVSALPSWQGIIVLLISLILFISSTQIKNLISKLFTKKRRCSDCIIMMFGISEKFRSQEDSINRNLLNKKMLYTEQRLETLILALLREYKQLQCKNKKADTKEDTIDTEYWGFKHSITNAMFLIKKSIKITYITNGFHHLSGQVFSIYVKDKTQEILSIFEQFLMNDHPKNTIVSLNEVLNMIDKHLFEDLLFEIYINAKQIQNDADDKIQKLESQLMDEINKFTGGNNYINTNCKYANQLDDTNTSSTDR